MSLPASCAKPASTTALAASTAEPAAVRSASVAMWLLRLPLGLEVFPLLLDGQAGSPAPFCELDGHLARGLVDHLGAEHHGPGALDVCGVLVGLEECLRLVELLLRRSEDLVRDADLAGVQSPLAVVAEAPRPHRHLAVSVGVLDQEVGTIDRLQACI